MESVPFFRWTGRCEMIRILMRGQMPFDEMVDWIDAQLVDLSKKTSGFLLEMNLHNFMVVPLPSCVWRFVPVCCCLLQVRW